MNFLHGGKNVVVARWVMQVPEQYVSNRPFVELFCLYVMIGGSAVSQYSGSSRTASNPFRSDEGSYGR